MAVKYATILWKKVRQGELSRDEAFLAARFLEAADIEFLLTHYLPEVTRIAVELDHPACDCVGLVLATEGDCRFVTADEQFVRKLGEGHRR